MFTFYRFIPIRYNNIMYDSSEETMEFEFVLDKLNKAIVVYFSENKNTNVISTSLFTKNEKEFFCTEGFVTNEVTRYKDGDYSVNTFGYIKI